MKVGKEQRKNIAYKILSMNCKAKTQWEKLLSQSRSLSEIWMWVEILCSQITKYVDRNLKDLIKLSEKKKKRKREVMDESNIIEEESHQRRRNPLRNRPRRGPRANMRESSSSSSSVSSRSEGCELCGGRETGPAVSCSECSDIYHLSCLNMKRAPVKEWTCMDCLERWAAKLHRWYIQCYNSNYK